MFHFCLYSAHIAYSIPSVLLCEKARKYMEGIADAVVNEAKPSVCVCVCVQAYIIHTCCKRVILYLPSSCPPVRWDCDRFQLREL